jgi:hypothetical protein
MSRFLAPVQQAGSALSVEVRNVEDKTSVWSVLSWVWPAIFALIAWAYAWLAEKKAWTIIGWTLLLWATLRMPNGTGPFFAVLALFAVWHIAIPALRRLWQMPRKPNPVAPPPAAAATTAILLLALIPAAFAQEFAEANPVAETVTQQIRVEEKFALATAKIHWQATKGQRLPLLFDPAVLTKATYPNNALKARDRGRSAENVRSMSSRSKAGRSTSNFNTRFRDEEGRRRQGFVLPTQFGLVNQLALTLVNLDVDVVSPQAVSIERKAAGKDTTATLVLAPANDIWIAWKPRSRDVAREKGGLLRGADTALRTDRRSGRGPCTSLRFVSPGRAWRACFSKSQKARPSRTSSTPRRWRRLSENTLPPASIVCNGVSSPTPANSA